LELFFSKVRRLGGCNNNPTCQQFISAYRKLIVHSDLQDVLRGNCMPLESVPILTASSSITKNTQVQTPSAVQLNSSLSRTHLMESDNFENGNIDEDSLPPISVLSSCSTKIVAYIAGFVVFRLQKSLHCEPCISALSAPNDIPDIYSLIRLKSRGNLVTPSQDVIDICLQCEKYFRTHVSINNHVLSNVHLHELSSAVLKDFMFRESFTSISEHMYV
jgi:hypothetical protein